MVSSTCGRTGHVAIQCFHKIGYPAWWGERSRPKIGDYSNQGVPSNSSGTRNIQPAHANQVVTTTASANSVTNADRIGIVGFSNTQWQSLKLLLSERDQSQEDVDWSG